MIMKKRWSQIAVSVTLAVISALCLMPFLLLVAGSMTSESSISLTGYTFFPTELDFGAYQYLWSGSGNIMRAYGITVFVTAAGTTAGLLITAMLAYPISRKDFPYRGFFSFFVFFTILFNGGLVPTYLLYTSVFDFKNTLWALIVPILLVRGFFVILMRTFFQTTIPNELIESAYIDGAGEWNIFFNIVMPLSLPVLAAVGLFKGLSYWNDWFNGLIFLTDAKLYSIQNLLNRMLLDLEFLKTAASSGSVTGGLLEIPTRGMRMAVAVIGVLPILAIYPFIQKYFVKGLTLGAVKG